MSSQSPVVEMKEKLKLLFRALKFIESFDGDVEAATQKENGEIGDRR